MSGELSGLAALRRLLTPAARSQGYHTVGFHGTRTPTLVGDVLRPDISPHTTFDRMLGPHVALDPRLTDAFTIGEYAKNTNPPWVPTGDPRHLWGQDKYGQFMIEPGGNVIPVALRGKFKKVKDDSQTGELRNMINREINDEPELFAEWFTKARNSTPEAAEAILKEFRKGNPVALDAKERPIDLSTLEQIASPDYSLTGLTYRPKGLEGLHIVGYREPADIVRDYDAYMYGLKPKQHRLLVDKFKQRLSDEGYSGVEYINTSPNEVKGDIDPRSIIVSDPTAIRSVFGEFNPEYSHSAAGLGLKRGGLVALR